ncbi:MAG: V-type ATPase subunit [Candidatus Micrarchaeota archaeon]
MSYIGQISTRYAYSATRVKAMESELIAPAVMKNIIQAKDVGSMLSLLSQTSYKKELEQFGGIKMSSEMIDFALSKNLALNVSKLITITPTEDKEITRAIVGKWDIYNIELAIEAKYSKKSFEEIARYIIDYGPYNANVIKEAFREASVEGLISKLSINSPYKDILSEAFDEFKKSGDALKANMLIDKLYYQKLGSLMRKIEELSPEAAKIIKLEIDMRNLLNLIRGKHYALKFNEISESLIKKGSLSIEELQSIYEHAKNEEEIARNAKVFDLSNEIEIYKKEGRLFAFEIGMKNQILSKGIKMLSHTLLSFGTILAYAYIKGIEVLTLRIIIKSKQYALPQEEVARMILWKE